MRPARWPQTIDLSCSIVRVVKLKGIHMTGNEEDVAGSRASTTSDATRPARSPNRPYRWDGEDIQEIPYFEDEAREMRYKREQNNNGLK
jgi:hypothetical protein